MPINALRFPARSLLLPWTQIVSQTLIASYAISLTPKENEIGKICHHL